VATESAVVAVVGDVFPTRPNFDDGQPRVAEFAPVVDLLRSADVAFGNFEIACSEKGYPVQKAITIRTSPDNALQPRDLGLDVVLVANNHIMDYGPEALLDTIARLDEHGVRHVGGGADVKQATDPVILERAGLRIGFVGWSTLLPTGAAATEQRPGLAPIAIHTSYEVDPYYLAEEPATPAVVRTWADPDALRSAEEYVRSLREEVDYLIVGLHWGSGITTELAEYQRPLGHALLDAGADAIAGSHPHAVHGIELYKGKPIFYSPGLFLDQVPREGDPEILALYDLMSPDSYAALLDVTAEGLASLKIVPTSSAKEDGLPRFAEGAAFDRIATRLTEASAALDTEVRIDSDALTVPLADVPAAPT
jgi:poly-gamma-glutamate capsule biosynthesis protein CapA/YwtB (metallophosphatase superfamily)